MKHDYIKKAQKAWPLLVRRAKAKASRPYTYKELGDKIGLHWRAVGRALGVIQTYCEMGEKKQLPGLQALVVTGKSPRLPGEGYRASPITEAGHKKEIDKVRAYSWSVTPPSRSALDL